MVFDLFFRVGPAVKAIFELGYEPKEELFHELTTEQYAELEMDGEDIISTKWYTIIPQNPKYNVQDLLIIDDSDKNALLDAAEYIEKLCRKSEKYNLFSNYESKLQYAAGVLPENFSKSSSYVQKKEHLHLKLSK